MVQLSKPQIHSVLLEILKVVDKFCKEKGLRKFDTLKSEKS